MTIDTAALRQLCEKATPGPWKLRATPGAILGLPGPYVVEECSAVRPLMRILGYPKERSEQAANAAFIAAAREALPELLGRVEALEKVARAAKDLMITLGPSHAWGIGKDIHRCVRTFITALRDAGYGG